MPHLIPLGDTIDFAVNRDEGYLIMVAYERLGRPAITCEAHRSRQFHCHSRCFFLSGTPATASASVSSLKCALALLFP